MFVYLHVTFVTSISKLFCVHAKSHFRCLVSMSTFFFKAFFCCLVSMYRPFFAALCPFPCLLPLPCVHAFFHCLVSMSTFFFKAFFCCLVSMYRPAAAALRPCHRVHIYFCCLLSMSILFFKALKATVLTALSNSHTVSCDKHSLQKIFPLLNISLCLHGAKV